MSYFNKGPVQVLRGIVQELRRSNPKLKPISKTSAFSYIINEYRCHQITERRTCKSPNELHSVAKTYLCYLQSLREHQSKCHYRRLSQQGIYQELLQQYYHSGERSVDETARIVGFTLPNSPKETPTNEQ